jgi:tRNA (mo5U34)-methyltransferase
MLNREREIRDVGQWYHTFELPGGLVTDGYFDLRRVVGKLPLPASLAGSRCLDVAACEGFWSFELARRGADAVVSVDLPHTDQQDWQGLVPLERRRIGSGLANEHFHLIRDALELGQVERVDLNIYDVGPQELGTFDYVFVGNVLVHLADPVRALRAIRAAMRPDAELLSLEPTSLSLTLLSRKIPLGQLFDQDDPPQWWTPNMAAHRRFLHAAGFEVLDQGGPLFQPFGRVMPRFPRRPPGNLRELLWWLWVRPLGPASAWVRARPAAAQG